MEEIASRPFDKTRLRHRFIEAPDAHTLSVIHELDDLIHQLDASAPPLDAHFLMAITKCSRLLILEYDEGPEAGVGRLIGMATLVPSFAPLHMKGHIEDVIVHEEFRGFGLGRLLIEYVMEEATRLELEFLELTSRSSRTDANEMYLKLGFELRETNCYVLKRA